MHYLYAQHLKHFLAYPKHIKLFHESIKLMRLELFKSERVTVKLLAVKEKIYLLKIRNFENIKTFIRYCFV